MRSDVEPGDYAPDFELPNANSNVGGGSMALSDVMGEKGGVIVYVKHATTFNRFLHV